MNFFERFLKDALLTTTMSPASTPPTTNGTVSLLAVGAFSIFRLSDNQIIRLSDYSIIRLSDLGGRTSSWRLCDPRITKSVIDEMQKSPVEKRKRNLKTISPHSRGEREIRIPLPRLERRNRNLEFS